MGCWSSKSTFFNVFTWRINGISTHDQYIDPLNTKFLCTTYFCSNPSKHSTGSPDSPCCKTRLSVFAAIKERFRLPHARGSACLARFETSMLGPPPSPGSVKQVFTVFCGNFRRVKILLTLYRKLLFYSTPINTRCILKDQTWYSLYCWGRKKEGNLSTNQLFTRLLLSNIPNGNLSKSYS